MSLQADTLSLVRAPLRAGVPVMRPEASLLPSGGERSGLQEAWGTAVYRAVVGLVLRCGVQRANCGDETRLKKRGKLAEERGSRFIRRVAKHYLYIVSPAYTARAGRVRTWSM